MHSGSQKLQKMDCEWTVDWEKTWQEKWSKFIWSLIVSLLADSIFFFFNLVLNLGLDKKREREFLAGEKNRKSGAKSSDDSKRWRSKVIVLMLEWPTFTCLKSNPSVILYLRM